MPRGAAATVEQFEERKATARRVRAFEGLTEALASSLPVPSPVVSIGLRKHGLPPKLSAEAFELARQVYYLQHGTRSDAARAIIAAGLSDTDNFVQVYERLKTWWAREEWPLRPTATTFAIRDATHDGGLYRSDRRCVGVATGSGPAPKGKKCEHSALTDSDHCFHHDPRPEYVEARRRQAEKLTEGRRAGMVPLEPFQRWCDERRKEMLAKARASRWVHPNNEGWGLLADAMGVDLSILGRWMKGKHSARGRPPVTHIKAATVDRHLAPLGVTFSDVYGFDPPAATGNAGLICPECGGPKNHASTTCRGCYEASVGEACPYVNRAGKACGIPTKHESGYCYRCRRIVFRAPKPRTDRPTRLTPRLLLFALDEYRREPSLAWVARRLWAANIDGVRDLYRRRNSLTSTLVKQFRKRGWQDSGAVESAWRELLDEHGPVVEWPPSAADALAPEGMVPFEPFRSWLTDRYAELVAARLRAGRSVRGAYKELGERTGLDPDYASAWIRGTGDGAGKRAIRRTTVDGALSAWGDGTSYPDLMGGGL